MSSSKDRVALIVLRCGGQLGEPGYRALNTNDFILIACTAAGGLFLTVREREIEREKEKKPERETM